MFSSDTRGRHLFLSKMGKPAVWSFINANIIIFYSTPFILTYRNIVHEALILLFL